MGERVRTCSLRALLLTVAMDADAPPARREASVKAFNIMLAGRAEESRTRVDRTASGVRLPVGFAA